MQEVFKRIIERLEDQKKGNPFIYGEKDRSRDASISRQTLDYAIEIVRKEVEEDDNGWIPGEILPEDGVDVLVWFEYFRYGEYNRLFQTMGISYTYNGNWSHFVNGQSGWRQLRIIKWQPLPAAPANGGVGYADNQEY